jgi:hypothetical protein
VREPGVGADTATVIEHGEGKAEPAGVGDLAKATDPDNAIAGAEHDEARERREHPRPGP